METSRVYHAARRPESLRARVVNLAESVVRRSARDEDLAIVQQGGSVAGPGDGHRAVCERKGARDGVVQLRAGEGDSAVVSSGDEDRPVWEEGGGMGGPYPSHGT